MTDNTVIVNRALQTFGARTTVTASELTNNSSNEAIQSNLILTRTRDELARMAPWNCASTMANLTLITAAAGTPENTSAGTNLWQKGLPYPPWSYEYQWPADCLRPLWIVPQLQTGFSGGVPITTAVTGGAPAFWQGPPVKFKVNNDQFYPATAVAVTAAGLGHAAGDLITLAIGPISSNPIGAPAVVLVGTVGGGGAILTASLVNQVIGASPAQSGAYITKQTAAQAQGSTTGSGSGATFTLTYGALADQRVILTNQEFAALAYIKQVTDPNIMDELFQEAWAEILGARLVMALTGDKTLANLRIAACNTIVEEARKADGNEGLTINDVTPDWIRARGINFASDYATGPYSYDWGPMFPYY